MEEKWVNKEGLGTKRGEWAFNVLQLLLHRRFKISLRRFKVSTRAFDKEIWNFCRNNNMLMMMHVPDDQTRHVLAVRQGFVIDSLFHKVIRRIEGFDVSLLDRRQMYYLAADDICKVFAIAK